MHAELHSFDPFIEGLFVFVLSYGLDEIDYSIV